MSQPLPPLPLLAQGLYQTAYVVPDLAAAQRFFETTYGTPRFFVIQDAPVFNQTLRGQPIEAHQHVAFGYAGSMQIELIQPLAGKSTYTEFLRSRTPGLGVHHLGVQVQDLDRAVTDMAARGVPVVQTGAFGQGTRFVYLDTLATLGSYLELFFLDSDTQALFARIQRGEF